MPSQRYITGNASDDDVLEFRLSMLCNPDLELNDVFATLQRLPSNFPTDPTLPTGKFWIIGPAPNGLCFVYKQGTYIDPGKVTVHRHTDIVGVGISPIRVIAEVQR